MFVYNLLVGTNRTPTGMGIVQNTTDGTLRPITPCCLSFISFNLCERCQKEYPGNGTKEGGPVNDRWIQIDQGDKQQQDAVHGWIELILGATVAFDVRWD